MDFGFKNTPVETTDNNSSGVNNVKNEPVTDLDNSNLDNGDKTDLDNNGNEGINGVNNKDSKKEDSKSSDENKNNDNLEAGTTIDFEGVIYTVDDKGNLLDKDGNLFKEASEVKEWMNGYDNVENDEASVIDINNIIKSVGIEITGEDDKPVEFDNSIEGVKSYIEAVNEAKREEHYDTAINTLYQKYPILNDVLNYYIANGNSLEGFNEIPDRSNIIIDDTNEAQQESIIRTAWNEQKRKGDVESYIQYLKTSGTLLATAKEELEGLQENDKQVKEELAARAEEEELSRIKELETYWNGVHDVIKSRKIAGYEIPEHIIINRNGQKLSVTNEDFYNYLYRVDQEGKSQYERDLENESSESRRDDSILRAYLKFVGGNYSNLVNMAINKEKVTNIKLKARERGNKPSIKITKPANTRKNEIDFGY